MKEASAVFLSTASIRDLASGFRDAISSARAPGRGFLANRVAGSITFEKPAASNDPLDALDRAPDYEVVASIPLTGGFSVDVVRVFMFLAESDGEVRGHLSAYGPTGRRATRAFFTAAVDGIKKVDPGLQIEAA